MIADRDGATPRPARVDDLAAVDALTVECYAPIQESYVALLGRELCETVRHEPGLTRQEREIAYRHVLGRFRELGLRYALVNTGLDDAQAAARRAYEAVGFDRTVPAVEYWQDLAARNAGSTP